MSFFDDILGGVETVSREIERGARVASQVAGVAGVVTDFFSGGDGEQGSPGPREFRIEAGEITVTAERKPEPAAQPATAVLIGLPLLLGAFLLLR